MKRTSFCEGWEFARGDASSAHVVVPHDAMLGNRRDAEAPAGSASGYYYGDVYRYRKEFALSAEQAAGVLLLEFEGVYRSARIAVNGTAVETPPYGFVPFFVDLSGLVHTGSNVIEVVADNSGQPDCRWYSGGGIHRPVWLWEGGVARIAPEGVKVTTLSLDPAVVRVEVEATGGVPETSIVDADGEVVAGGSGAVVELEVPKAQLWSAEHPYLYKCRVSLKKTSPSSGEVTGHRRGELPLARRAEARHTSPQVEGERKLAPTARRGPSGIDEVDSADVSFGIRLLEWGGRGLLVNGRPVKLRGGCVHCDNGVIGAASFPASERRRVKLLKAAGFNAIRIAHNPAPAALLEACDELGMYVMDEAWDVWYTRKSAHDYSNDFLKWCDFDLRRLASRDYNHPSVVMYSIGNEVADPIEPAGVELERSMVGLLHSLDSSRPVTCGLNLTMMVMERAGRGWYDQADGVAEAATDAESAPHGSMLFNLVAQASGTGMTMIANAPGADKLVSPALDALDIAGYNYASARYGIDMRKHPARVIVGTETFPHELARNWKLVEKHERLVGDFMWAAWDYLGEAGAGAWAYTPEEAGFSKPWPWLVAGSGALDLLGQPNAHAALAGAVWKTAVAPSIQVRPVNVMDGKTYKATWRGSDAIPSWSWAGCAGMPAEVEVYDGRAHAIRLELNGEEVATKRVRSCVARFKCTYEPGELRAVSLDAQGRKLAHASLVSASDVRRLEARAESRSTRAGDVAYVPIAIVGRNGEVECNADELVHVSVEGGTLLGFGSARPATTESFLAGAYTTYRGRALAVVYRETPGEATVTVTAETLPPVSTTVAFS